MYKQKKMTAVLFLFFLQANPAAANNSFFNAFSTSYMLTGSFVYLCSFLTGQFLGYAYLEKVKRESDGKVAINLMDMFKEKAEWAKTLPDDERIHIEKLIADTTKEFEIRNFDLKKILPLLPVNNKSIAEDGNMKATGNHILISYWWFNSLFSNDEKQRNKFFGVLRHELNHIKHNHVLKGTIFSAGIFTVLGSIILRYGNMFRKIIMEYVGKNHPKYSFVTNNKLLWISMGVATALLTGIISKNIMSITLARHHEHVADILQFDNPEIMYNELQGLKQFLLDAQNCNFHYSMFDSHPSMKSRINNIDDQIALLEKQYPHLKRG